MFISNLNYLESVGQENDIQGGCSYCDYQPKHHNYSKKSPKNPKTAVAIGGLEAFAFGNNTLTGGNVLMVADSKDGFSTTLIAGIAAAEG
ncbi:MAG: hypothetical protein RLZZ568_185 [Cyanobacteriota bacterium]|jgi:hypothetical protein